MLPGNPGVPGYYRRFAENLAQNLGVEVVVLGLCGHTLEPKVQPWKVFTLDDQIEHVLGYIDSVHGDGELTIVGHSIGAYIALEAMHRRPKIVRYTLGLMPFLENNDADLAFSRLACLVRLSPPAFWSILAALCVSLALVRPLPLRLRRLLLAGPTGDYDAEWADFTADAILQPGVFANYAFMGRTEIANHAVAYDFAGRLGARLTARVRLLYTDGDMWAPKAVLEAARAAGVCAELHAGLRHAFCTRNRASAWVAGWVARQLRELVDTGTRGCRRPGAAETGAVGGAAPAAGQRGRGREPLARGGRRRPA